MGKITYRVSQSVLAAALGLILLQQVGAQQAVTAPPGQPIPRVSRFGDYRGYSEAVYDGWVRSSEYITVRDGTRLAMDLFRPSKNGVVSVDRLPVIWTHHRYHRSSVHDGKVIGMLDIFPWIATIAKHGYVIAVVDTRGGGASFGTQPGFFSREESRDAYDVTEWLAARPWSTGMVGMFSRSYLGETQYFAAAEAPPHLKAIFPEMAFFDLYQVAYPGGIYRADFFDNWNRLTKGLDSSAPFEWNGTTLGDPVAPVDADKKGVMLAAAINEHKANRDTVDFISPLQFRDSLDKVTGKAIFAERGSASYLSQIEKSGVAIYHLAGWFDIFPRDSLQFFRNLHNPQKVVIGPWFHSEYQGLDYAAEHLRWYDYWLKGIKNGVMDEEPIHYWTIGAPAGQEWRAASQWPLPNERRTNCYFQAGPSKTVQSANDGLLTTEAPRGGNGRDDYVVDYSTTLGRGNRWANGYGGPKDYPDLAPNDAKGLTYTSDPLAADTEVTGHPLAHLWVTSSAKDADFFVYLEEVQTDNHSVYVTEGALRASHRAVSTAPYDNVGAPYHRSFAADVADLPGQPVELAFDLHPTSKIFKAGNRIRITVTGADKDSYQTPVQSPAPKLTLCRDSTHASYVDLPLITGLPDPPNIPKSSPAIVLGILAVAALGLIVVLRMNRKQAGR
jgi:putative CocE/NonD family hydrolase